MPTLAQSLHSHDLGHLRIIAEHWGVELAETEARSALPNLSAAIQNPDLIAEIIDALPPESQSAINTLVANGGRLPWLQFTRRFGDLRAMGPGRRDRERPDREPVSSTEVLWYRALIARAFFDSNSGAQEFAYIPNDLFRLISAWAQKEAQTKIEEGQPQLGRAATPEERAFPYLANDRLLDHICTLLASHRLQIDPASQFPDSFPGLLPFATTLLRTANLLAPNGYPDLEIARSHLEFRPRRGFSPTNSSLAPKRNAQ